MLFNSLSFVLFFIAFFILYWKLFNKTAKTQNILLLFASYFFYLESGYIFLILLIISSTLNYFIAISIEKTNKKHLKNGLFAIGLLQGIGLLLIFKYNNVLSNIFNLCYEGISGNESNFTLKLLVPLGISFYTFRTLGYIIDVYQEKRNACKDWLIFFNYVSFFPSILAGPIDNSNSFIPQLEKKRVFNYTIAVEGCQQFLWGLFKKIVIADNCTPITSQIFQNYANESSSTLILGAFLFTIELYADFSGYSDMAIGIGKNMGLKITKNFNYPYFATSISDFWRRWHISLTGWLTEYVYTPLTFILRKQKKMGLIIAILINFILSGIWHGSKKTYLIFGLLHGIYFIPSIIKSKKTSVSSKIVDFFNRLLTFFIVMLTFTFFKCDTLNQSITYIKNILSPTIIHLPQIYDSEKFCIISISILIMFLLEWIHRQDDFGFTLNYMKNRTLKKGMIYLLAFIVLFFGSYDSNQFIYFQF
jgi:alginate O-acetyltransferase complex protein AlgI